MLFFIDQISDKPDWQRKVYNDKIIAKWKDEAKEVDWNRIINGGDMTDSMLRDVSLSWTR